MEIKIGKWFIIIALSLILCLGFYFAQSCKVYHKHSVLKGQYDALKNTLDAEVEMRDRAIKAKEEEIEELNTAIDSANVVITEKQKESKSKDVEIKELESLYPTLKDKDEQIENLKQQANVWKEQFFLAQEIITEKDTIIFSLTEKYNAQVEITKQWIAKYDRELALRKLAEEGWKMSDKRIVGLSLQSKVTKILIVAAGGYILYDKLKKEN